MTEYLNREFEKINTDKKVGYAYSQNVDFVELLHNVMGDSLIKAYLTGGSQAFEQEFSTYITDVGRFGGNVQRRTYEELGNRGQKIQ